MNMLPCSEFVSSRCNLDSFLLRLLHGIVTNTNIGININMNISVMYNDPKLLIK